MAGENLILMSAQPVRYYKVYFSTRIYAISTKLTDHSFVCTSAQVSSDIGSPADFHNNYPNKSYYIHLKTVRSRFKAGVKSILEEDVPPKLSKFFLLACLSTPAQWYNILGHQSTLVTN